MRVTGFSRTKWVFFQLAHAEAVARASARRPHLRLVTVDCDVPTTYTLLCDAGGQYTSDHGPHAPARLLNNRAAQLEGALTPS